MISLKDAHKVEVVKQILFACVSYMNKELAYLCIRAYFKLQIQDGQFGALYPLPILGLA